MSQLEIIERLKRVFTCTYIFLSREPHKSGGYHYHVGVKTVNASKNSYARLVRATFPEFEGMQLDVQAKKGWGPVCAYVTKEDKSPLIWGEYNLEQVLELAEAFRARRKSKGLANNPSGVDFKKRPFVYTNAICWILTFQAITSILNLTVPAIFPFLYEHLIECFQHLKSLWEGEGAEPPSGLPSDIPDSSKTTPIFIGIGACYFYYFNSN